MNTGKQINIMALALFILLIAAGAYTLWDPFRSDDAEEAQVEKAVNRGAETFALNCRLCHGDRGQGGQAGGRLAAALPLDTDELKGIDREGIFRQDLKDKAFKLVTDPITCGRVDTAMPAWGEAQGGPLNEEQIRQLAVLITEGRLPDGRSTWELAQEHADELDAAATEHATVQMPDGALDADETELIVSNAGPFSLGQYIRIEDERLRVLPRQLEVERGVQGTEPADHESGVDLRRSGAPVGDPEAPVVLTEDADAEATAFVVSSIEEFRPGDILQVDDERVRVLDIQQGLPTTGQVLAEEIGRTPDSFLVSGAEGIEVGTLIRIEGELMEVVEIRDDGDPGIELETDASQSADQIAVSDPTFFRPEYVLRLGDELLRVVGPVDTGQTLGETIGRAETRFAVSGTEGLEEGMVIRLGSELMRIVSLQPARVRIERGAEDTEADAHDSGVALLRAPAPAEESEEAPTEEELDTGQRLLEAASSDDDAITVTGTSGISIDGLYQIEDETVRVVDIEPAQVTVERGVGDAEREPHSRRVSIFEGNLLEVERGAQGTQAAAHQAGAPVFLFELEVERGAQDSEKEQHAKGAELFLGNRLIVARGVQGTEPAQHENGQLVRDFPRAPGGSTTAGACGYRGSAAAGPTPPAGPTPTPVAGAQQVRVSLKEFSVTPDPASVPAGPVSFLANNDGEAAQHNLRVIRTELPPDQLPVSGTQVDEDAVEVIARSSDLPVGQSETVSAQLEAGNYVLICNIPGHYQLGMTIGFQVTGP